MNYKTHCPIHMPDRPLDPEDLEPYPDEQDPDEAYDEQRQREIDERYEKLTSDDLVDFLPALTPGFIFKHQAD